jgi:hypothetical protein
MNVRNTILASVADPRPPAPRQDRAARPDDLGHAGAGVLRHEARGSTDEPEVIGFYSNGCVAGAQALPETGPTWQAMRLSRNRNWGHPELIDYITGLSRQVAATTSWNGLYVGDMSQPRGGPMLTGPCQPPVRPRRRYLDAARARPGLSVAGARKPQLHFHAVPARRVDFNDNWTEDHAQVLRLAASDPGRAHLRRHRDQGLALPERDREPRLPQPDPSRERTSLPFPRAARLSCRVAQL